MYILGGESKESPSRKILWGTEGQQQEPAATADSTKAPCLDTWSPSVPNLLQAHPSPEQGVFHTQEQEYFSLSMLSPLCIHSLSFFPSWDSSAAASLLSS